MKPKFKDVSPFCGWLEIKPRREWIEIAGQYRFQNVSIGNQKCAQVYKIQDDGTVVRIGRVWDFKKWNADSLMEALFASKGVKL